MTTGIDWDADLAFITADLGDSMTWNSTAYSVVIDPVSKGERMDEIAGVRGDVDFLIVARSSLFSSTRPVAGDQVTVGGVIFRIVRVDTDEADAALTLYVQDITA